VSIDGTLTSRSSEDLWTTGRSDFKGRYFTMNDCRCLPLPRGKIDVVYAGASQRGHRFAADYADYNFTIAQGVEGLHEANTSLANEAKQAGRNVTAYPLYMLIIDDTDEAAQAKLAHYEAGADVEAFAHSRAETAATPAPSACGRLPGATPPWARRRRSSAAPPARLRRRSMSWPPCRGRAA
jgi:pyrimidine oxygenase